MASVGDDSETDSLLDSFSSSSTPGGTNASAGQGGRDNVDSNVERGSNDESGEDESDREGRFEGPLSNWRTFTESERTLATSLDQQRANDLSIHLYNTHALKARVRDPAATKGTKSQKSKRSWIKANDDGSLPWHPAESWSAWPMKPEHVPRKNEQFGVPILNADRDGEAYRRVDVWTPGADLEEELIALMQRRTKDEFYMRNVETQPNDIEDPSRSDEDQRPVSASNSSKKNEGVAMRSSDTTTDAASVELLVDDEEASAILQPTACFVVSKLDELLMALHNNRKGQARENTKSRSRDGRSRSRSQVQSRSRSNTKSQSRRRDKRSNDSEDDSESDASDSEGSNEDRNPPKAKRKRRLNPRDWSEVLGNASLAGWNPAVIERATRRCASLFGEEMSFENTTPTPAPEISDQNLGFACPVLTCSRHKDPYRQAWRWREHLKRSHKYSTQEVEEIEEDMRSTPRDGEDVEVPEESEEREKPAGAANNSRDAALDDQRLDIKANPQPERNNDFLHPITVRMQRGKDVQKRKPKSSTSRKGRADQSGI